MAAAADGLPPGVRFDPADDELVSRYLLRRRRSRRRIGDRVAQVVLQFAKDDDIGFGGSHSAQVLLSRDRKLTPITALLRKTMSMPVFLVACYLQDAS
uniref:Uncharacterized protein n=1 Tax=Oryza glumipatula TaxID=40148 RepID=A0A0D9Y4M0_9ORYZ